MKKILLLFFLLNLKFGFSQSDEYIELDRNWAYSQWKGFIDGLGESKKYAKIIEDSDKVFSYSFEITGNYTQESKDKYSQLHKYYFNSSGFIQSIVDIRPYSNEKWVENKLAFKELPISSKENDFKETGTKKNDISILERINYEGINWTVDNVVHKIDLSLSIAILPAYNKSRTRVVKKKKHIITTKRARTKGENYSDVSTTFGDDIDLMDESMLYRIDEYVYAFLLDVGAPQIFNTRYLTNTELKIPKLNEKDRLFIWDIGGGTRENVKVEFKDLPENTIAVAVGNVFETGLFHMIIDPIKFREASAPKRAFIVWHEGYHCLGLDHGQCGKIMFPYADKDYTWREWNEAREEAIECWTEKRNLLNGGDIEIDNSLEVEYYKSGFEKFENNDYEGAINDFDKVIEINPYNYVALLMRGSSKYEKSDYNEAITDYSKYIELTTEYQGERYEESALPGYYKRASAFQKLHASTNDSNNLYRAISDYTEAIKLKGPTNDLVELKYIAKSYNGRGLCKSYLKDYKASINDYTKSIELDPKANTYANRAFTRKLDNDFYGAIDDYTKSIEIDPNNLLAYQNRAETKSLVNDLNGALDDYTKVIEIEKTSIEAYYNRAQIKEELKDFKGSIIDLKTAIDIIGSNGDPRFITDQRGLDRISVDFYLKMATLKMVLGDFKDALNDFTKVIDIDPSNPAGWIGRAVSKVQLGDHLGACKDWKKAAELGNTDAAELVANQCN